MYRVYCDNFLLYHSKLDNLKIINPSVELELNKTGSFDFSIYPDHPYFDMIKKLKSIITVYQGDHTLFRGRVLDEEVGWHNQKNIICEGDLSFLIDSIQRPFVFTGTPAEVLNYVLLLHNAQVDQGKRFLLGNVTVEGSLTVDLTEHTNSLETLQKHLLDGFGGYLMTRTVNGATYLDYLSEINLLAPQTIQFGKNLLDLKRIRKGADIATVIIPLGAMTKDEEGNDTNQRLTIETVNEGADFIQDADAIAQYGTIVKSVIFDDITDPAELKLLGEAQLADSVNLWETIELTAADLATVDKDITSFHLGTQVNVKSKPHSLDQRFLVSKLSIKLLEPAASQLVLGKTVPAFSEAVKGISEGQGQIIQEMQKTAQTASDAVYNIEQNLQSSLTSSEDNVKLSVSETHYLKEDVDAIVSKVSTDVEVTKGAMEIQFTQFNQDVEALAKGMDAEFEEIRKFIRFVDGKVLIGEVGNLLELQIANDRISFLQDGAEVAYFSNRKLYVTDAEILHSLRLGNFSFVPRANGNLSFKKA